MRSSRPTRRSFTLVELLIVVIIIGILAAVAIPQFGDSSQDAKIAALDQNLACLRTAVELYQYQHGSTFPGIVATHRASILAGAVAHGSASEAFVKQLTVYSDTLGNTCDEKNASFPYGPYIKKSIPSNPLPADTATGNPAGVTVANSTIPLAADNAPTTGWKASNATGEVIANNASHASR